MTSTLHEAVIEFFISSCETATKKRNRKESALEMWLNILQGLIWSTSVRTELTDSVELSTTQEATRC
jgi:hypothetical protein